MYQAASAAGNSACLSRQVGAAIVDSSGKVLSIGWNDVPKFGGDLYRVDSEGPTTPVGDHRCFNWKGGKCFNDEEKNFLALKVVDELVKSGHIATLDRQNAAEVLRKSPIRSLIEFSRSIHAEMHAILCAAENGGQRLRGGKLYCTTYPCHSCARHIVAAGISEVYYIEPYRKSLAIKLHDDAISENEDDHQKVRLIPFDGVAPSRYLSMFRMGADERKKSGLLVRVNPRDAHPVLKNTLESIPALEGLVVQGLIKRRLLEGAQ
jgi:deoxycytidylate deaminase